MNVEKIYPHIYNDIPSAPPLKGDFPEEDLLKPYIERIKISSIHEFQNQRNKLEELLIHYKKLKTKWTNVDSCIKIISIVLSGSTGILAGIFPIVMPLPILTVALGTLSGTSAFLGGSTSIGLSGKKKKQYREVCSAIEHGIDKLYIFQTKALNDNILSDEEIEQSINIVNNIKDEIGKLKK